MLRSPTEKAVILHSTTSTIEEEVTFFDSMRNEPEIVAVDIVRNKVSPPSPGLKDLWIADFVTKHCIPVTVVALPVGSHLCSMN
ncbi:hypothetical protein CEXT_347911 [Caerostris extrusa]|uniref:Uncharacterized protein n=1 Tax=Caerostris extrusa TaxID=172846 RepID=A0AAV4RY85_CAEEX|nr:hypothetical protein CEXT_347911 [Caerostris extrusa]